MFLENNHTQKCNYVRERFDDSIANPETENYLNDFNSEVYGDITGPFMEPEMIFDGRTG